MDGNYSVDSSIEKKEASRGIKFFAFEIVAVIILIGFILGALQYLNIVDFNSFLPQPIQNITSKILIAQPSITITSKIPELSARIEDKKGLINLLNSWKTFEKPYDFGTGGSTGGKNLKKINIIITDKFDSTKFPWTLYKDKSGKEYLSSNLNLSPSTLTLYISMDKDILSEPEQRTSLHIQTITMSTIYKMTHITPLNENPTKREEEISALLKQLNSKIIYFRVLKK